MIRILHIVSSLHLGGSQSFVINLYQKVDRTKIQFDFVVFPEEHKGLYELVEQMGGRIFTCPRYKGKNHFAYCKWWNDFFVQHTEYKVIHGHNRSTSAVYLEIAKRHGCIAIAHSHSISNGNGILGAIKNVMQWPTRFIADYLFACSEDAGKWMYGADVLKKSNFKVIRNGIDCKKFAYDDQKRKEMRRKLGCENRLLVGNVGRITLSKNHRFLLETFKIVCQYEPDAKLLLIGDGELMQQMKQNCKTLGIEDAVIFTGEKTNIEDYYQAMDVFAFPSLWEGLGIVAIEAQASGLPVLISENVPKEAKLAENVSIVALNQGAQGWAKEIISLDRSTDRTMGYKAVVDGGYDIFDVAEKMQAFYLQLCQTGASL